MAKVYFIDVTNRDGVQTARINLAKLQKTLLNYYLSLLGVRQSEFGFPFLPSERNYIRANLALAERGAFGDLILSGWVRAVPQDVARALPTGVRHLNLSISTSDQMIAHKFRGRLDRESIVREMVQAVRAAREGGILTIGVNAEDASRTDLGYLVEFAQAAKEAGADRIRYCDTLGCESPARIYERTRKLAAAVGLPLEMHTHNDLGLAVANAVAGAQGAVDGGVDAYVNATVNGIGERAGNADLLSCLLALRYACGLHETVAIGDDLDLSVAWRLARYAAQAFGVPIPINQPGVGANAFAHESGIHADGALKDRDNYELFDYAVIGRAAELCEPTGRIITTGEFGGQAGLQYVYQTLGVAIDPAEAAGLLELVQYASAHTQLPLTDDELLFIARYPAEVRQLLTVTP